MTVWPLTADKLTVKVASTGVPSPSTTVTPTTDSDGTPSSSMMVAIPDPAESETEALTAVDKSTVNVSEVPSSWSSPSTSTETVFVNSPGEKVSVPDVAE